MTDTLRARIGAVQLAHMPDDYERGMGECPCGFKYQKWSELASHVADAVIAELGLEREYVHHVTDWMSLTDDTTGDVNHD